MTIIITQASWKLPPPFTLDGLDVLISLTSLRGWSKLSTWEQPRLSCILCHDSLALPIRDPSTVDFGGILVSIWLPRAGVSPWAQLGLQQPGSAGCSSWGRAALQPAESRWEGTLPLPLLQKNDRMSLFMEDRKEKLGPSEPLAMFTKAHHKPSWSFLMSAHVCLLSLIREPLPGYCPQNTSAPPGGLAGQDVEQVIYREGVSSRPRPGQVCQPPGCGVCLQCRGRRQSRFRQQCWKPDSGAEGLSGYQNWRNIPDTPTFTLG